MYLEFFTHLFFCSSFHIISFAFFTFSKTEILIFFASNYMMSKEVCI